MVEFPCVRLIASALAVSGVSLLSGCSPLQPLRAASSYTSHMICSETFISGLCCRLRKADQLTSVPGAGAELIRPVLAQCKSV
jgi:hypothetical protein